MPRRDQRHKQRAKDKDNLGGIGAPAAGEESDRQRHQQQEETPGLWLAEIRRLPFLDVFTQAGDADGIEGDGEYCQAQRIKRHHRQRKQRNQ